MIFRILVFLFLAAKCQANIYCDFKEDQCNWSNIYACPFKHVTEEPLAGKTGYLMLSQDTCNVAAISIPMKSEDPRFRFEYFFNGTGRAMIYVYAVFSYTGRTIIWECAANQGPKWNDVEVLIMDSFFNSLKSVIIEVNIIGDVTIAIGNIEKPKHGRIDRRCPPSKPIIKSTTTTTAKLVTTKAAIKNTSPKPETAPDNAVKNHTICDFNVDLCQWRDINHLCHFKHVKDTSLLGETGYLMLSEDTCKRATLLVRLKEFDFQLHYLMKGTGNMSLTVGVLYGFAGREPIWSCSSSQGLKWHKVDINVQLIHFDPRISVYIDAEVSGDSMIAIGNIANAGNGAKEKMCPSSAIPKIATSSAPLVTREDIAEGAGKEATQKIDIMPKLETVDEIDGPESPLIIEPDDGTEIKDTVRLDEDSERINVKLLPGAEQVQQKSSSHYVGLMGGSVVAGVLFIVIAMFSVFMYRRKTRLWRIQSTTQQENQVPYETFVNPLYK